MLEQRSEIPDAWNGEGGIRTLGWVLRFHQQISNLPLFDHSATSPGTENTS